MRLIYSQNAMVFSSYILIYIVTNLKVLTMSHSHSSDQGFSKDIEQGARGWFIGAGIFTLLLAFALYTVDERLSHSKREQILGATLKELRTAQNSLPTGNTDTRTAEAE